MINNVVLIGRLTTDIDLRYTKSGTAVGSFRLAVNRNFTNQSGNREADFINCVIWRKPAETMANYTRKGSLVGIVGRIQTRSYENPQGQRVYVTEVVCENYQLLESLASVEQRQNKDRDDSNTQEQNNNFPKNNSKQSTYSPPIQNEMPEFDRDPDPFRGMESTIDISDDDLPF